MGGRSDYEERKQKRIERYKILSEKAKERSNQYMNSSANKTLERIPLGQPILVDHYSAKGHRNLLERAQNNIKKSIEEDKKSEFYSNRAESAENSKVIYSDDPRAIEKLKEKLERLENERNSIKEREHYKWELTNIGANIRETKKRIERLEKLEEIKFEDVKFDNCKVIHNKEINRIQFLFNEIPNENIRRELKSNGFHWSRKEQAWQREFNQNCIRATNRIVKDIFEKNKNRRTRKNLNKLELFNEMYELTEHNLLCYSENYLMTKPKSKFIKEWNREKEKLELLKEIIEEEKQIMKVKNINFTQKQILKMYPNTIYYVKNSNGGLLAGCIELEEAKRYAEEYKTEYMKDKLNNKIGVYVFDKEGKNLYVAKGTKKEEIEEFE